MPSTKIDYENSRRSASSETEYEKVAHSLTANYHMFGFPGMNKPMAYAVRFDGSLSVVAANGQKFIFSKEEVAQAQEQLKALQKPPGRPRRLPQERQLRDGAKVENARSGRPGGRETAPKPKKTG